MFYILFKSHIFTVIFLLKIIIASNASGDVDANGAADGVAVTITVPVAAAWTYAPVLGLASVSVFIVGEIVYSKQPE